MSSGTLRRYRMIPEVLFLYSEEADMKTNNYNNVHAKLKIYLRKIYMQQSLVLFGSIREKVDKRGEF